LNEADFRDMFKKASKSGCTSTIVLSPDPFSLTPINFFKVCRLQQTQKRTLMTLNQQLKELSR
jgi:hypothetical protein